MATSKKTAPAVPRKPGKPGATRGGCPGTKTNPDKGGEEDDKETLSNTTSPIGADGRVHISKDLETSAKGLPLPKQKSRWSSALSLQTAVSRAPVVIRLEEGHRGLQEELSLSAGDTMALEGLTQHRGDRVVMTYHVREKDGEAKTEEENYNTEETEEDDKFFRLLPYDNLPEVDVRVLEDSSGHAYANYLAWHFSTCNWTQQREELLDKMGDNSYINVSSIIVPNRRTPPASQDKEEWSLHTKRPPPPPPPSRQQAIPPGHPTPPGPAPNCEGVEGEVGEQPAPPPRPPRAPQRSVSVPASSPPSPSPAQPPPRPPRRSADDRPPPSPPEEEEEEAVAVFDLPTFAELFSGGSSGLDPDGKTIEPLVPQREVLLPMKVPPDKDKKKHSTLQKMKTLGIKLYGGVSKVTSPIHSWSSKSSQEGTTSPPSSSSATVTSTPTVEEEADDSSDDDDANYTVIDESMMDPVFDKPPQSDETIASKAKQKDAKGDKPKTAGKATKAAVIRPTLRVQPQGLSGQDVTSQSTSSTSNRPKAGSKPLTLQTTSPVSNLPPSHHPLMSPKDSMPGKNGQEKDSPKLVTCPLQNMTCEDLYARLRQCGMPALAQVCKNKSLDGLFFCALTDEALKQPPFSLDSFEVETKLKMVKAGWVPK